MDHHPTSFLVLDNKELGTFWVGQANIKPGANDHAIGRDKLIDKLSSKYEEEYPHLCFDIESIACEIYKFHEIEKWITDLLYQIKRKPFKLVELNELLTAGWGEGDYTTNSTIHVLRVNKTREGLRNTYKKLISEWEAKGLRCLNTQKCKTYEDKKKDPEFMYKRARKEVLRQMMKTRKMPKQSTIEKYQIKDEEIKECMGRKGIIYKITSPSGKVYVGQTIKKFNDRISQHKSEYSNCTLVKRAIDKYKDQMKYEIIEENILLEQLDEREIYWIKELNSLAPNGYNCNSGGDAQRNLAQETRNKIRDRMNKAKIERDGYLGDVQQTGNVFYPRVRPNGKKIYLSNGSFHTREQAIEVLKEYTKDPENFTKVDGTVQRSVGCVCKDGNRWKVSYKSKHVGCYETEEEAREALEIYIKDSVNFVKPVKRLGCIYRNGPSWGLTYKGKYLGTYATEEEAEEARKSLV
jgi:group I intron endonuclease